MREREVEALGLRVGPFDSIRLPGAILDFVDNAPAELESIGLQEQRARTGARSPACLMRDKSCEICMEERPVVRARIRVEPPDAASGGHRPACFTGSFE